MSLNKRFVETKSTFLTYALIKHLWKLKGKNSDLASTKCSSTSIYTVKTQVFCNALRKNQVFLRWKSITKCISSRPNRYFYDFGEPKSTKNRSQRHLGGEDWPIAHLNRRQANSAAPFWAKKSSLDAPKASQNGAQISPKPNKKMIKKINTDFDWFLNQCLMIFWSKIELSWDENWMSM